MRAATSAAVFAAYLDRVLLPQLRRTRPGAVLVMDNLAAYKAPRVKALLDACGFAYRYLPAYSPDLNPIEPAPRSAPPIAASQTDRFAMAKVKAELRRVAVRTPDALHKALGPALDAITPSDAAGCFRHCGYGCPDYPALCSEGSRKIVRAVTRG